MSLICYVWPRAAPSPAFEYVWFAGSQAVHATFLNCFAALISWVDGGTISCRRAPTPDEKTGCRRRKGLWTWLEQSLLQWPFTPAKDGEADAEGRRHSRTVRQADNLSQASGCRMAAIDERLQDCRRTACLSFSLMLSMISCRHRHSPWQPNQRPLTPLLLLTEKGGQLAHRTEAVDRPLLHLCNT